MFVACSFANELKISGGCANTDQDLWKMRNKYSEMITLSKMKCDGIGLTNRENAKIFLIKYWTADSRYIRINYPH